MSVSSPAVLRATVLPPVLGPVMTQQIEVAAELQADRDHVAGQQRVAGALEPQHRVTCCARNAHELGRVGPLVVGERRFGARQVERRQAQHGAGERLPLLADGAAERTQDALDLVLFFGLQRAPAIAHLDHGQRLDEQGGAARRLVVHDGRYLAAGVGADRNHVAAGALGDDRVLDGVAELRGGHQVT